MENITEKEKREMNIEDDGETEAHHGQTVTAPRMYFDIFASISSVPFRIARPSQPRGRPVFHVRCSFGWCASRAIFRVFLRTLHRLLFISRVIVCVARLCSVCCLPSVRLGITCCYRFCTFCALRLRPLYIRTAFGDSRTNQNGNK